MSASSDSEITRSPTSSSSVVTSPSEDDAINSLVDKIRSSQHKWAFGDKFGVAYSFTGDRLFKHNNVVGRSGVRTRFLIRNTDAFYTKLHSLLQEGSFVVVELCGSAEANLMYCHSKLVHLEPKRYILLIGEVYFVQGHFNNYFAESVPVESRTVVKLHSRAFDVRISSNRHSIFVRTEDVLKNRIRTDPLEIMFASSQVTGDSEQESEEDTDVETESYDPDSGREEDSTDGSRGGNVRLMMPPNFGPLLRRTPGTARRARMVHAGTQTTPRQAITMAALLEAAPGREPRQPRSPHTL